LELSLVQNCFIQVWVMFKFSLPVSSSAGRLARFKNKFYVSIDVFAG